MAWWDDPEIQANVNKSSGSFISGNTATNQNNWWEQEDVQANVAASNQEVYQTPETDFSTTDASGFHGTVFSSAFPNVEEQPLYMTEGAHGTTSWADEANKITQQIQAGEVVDGVGRPLTERLEFAKSMIPEEAFYSQKPDFSDRAETLVESMGSSSIGLQAGMVQSQEISRVDADLNSLMAIKAFESSADQQYPFTSGNLGSGMVYAATPEELQKQKALLTQKLFGEDGLSSYFEKSDWIRGFSPDMSDNDPRTMGFWNKDVPSGVASAFTFMGNTALATLLGRGKGGKGKGTPLESAIKNFSLIGAQGSMAQKTEEFRTALNGGASLEDALKAGDIGSLVGISEAVPLARILNRLDRSSGGTITQTIKNLLIEGTEEAMQEAFQVVMSNLIASDFVGYDPERGMWQDAKHGAQVGFTTGAIVSFLASLVQGRKSGLSNTLNQNIDNTQLDMQAVNDHQVKQQQELIDPNLVDPSSPSVDLKTPAIQAEIQKRKEKLEQTKGKANKNKLRTEIKELESMIEPVVLDKQEGAATTTKTEQETTDPATDDVYDTLDKVEIEPIVAETKPIVEKAVEKKDETGYRGAHTAPSAEGANSLDNLSDIFPDDIYSNKGANYYGHGEVDKAADQRVIDIIHSMRGNPEKEVMVYRAVPEGVDAIHKGDWVTLDKDYAAQHGMDAVDAAKDMPVISMKVKAKELNTDGNSIYEWGYNPISPKKEAVAEEKAEEKPSVETKPIVDEFKTKAGKPFKTKATIEKQLKAKGLTDQYTVEEKDGGFVGVKAKDIKFQVSSKGEGRINAADAIKIAKSIPFFKYLKQNQVEQILTPNGQKAFGSYGSGVVNFVNKPHETTLPHETFHGFVDMVAEPEQFKRAINAVKRRKGNTDISDIEAEEIMAQEFAEWFVGNQKPKNALQKFYQWLKDVMLAFSKDKAVIHNLFKDVISPSAKPREQQEVSDSQLVEEAMVAFQESPKDFTTKLISYIEANTKDVVSYAHLKNVVGAGKKTASNRDKTLVEYAMELPEFKDNKKIVVDDFIQAITRELLEFSIIENETMADYGLENIDVDYDVDAKTVIINTNFEHGVQGHFGGDFNKTTKSSDLIIRHIPAGTHDIGGETITTAKDQHHVVLKNLDIDNLEEGSFDSFDTDAEAQKYIDNFADRVREKAGMFSHFRVMTTKIAGKLFYYVTEYQSDTLQGLVNPNRMYIKKVARSNKELRKEDERLLMGGNDGLKVRFTEDKEFKSDIKSFELAVEMLKQLKNGAALTNDKASKDRIEVVFDKLGEYVFSRREKSLHNGVASHYMTDLRKAIENMLHDNISEKEAFAKAFELGGGVEYFMYSNDDRINTLFNLENWMEYGDVALSAKSTDIHEDNADQRRIRILWKTDGIQGAIEKLETFITHNNLRLKINNDHLKEQESALDERYMGEGNYFRSDVRKALIAVKRIKDTVMTFGDNKTDWDGQPVLWGEDVLVEEINNAAPRHYGSADDAPMREKYTYTKLTAIRDRLQNVMPQMAYRIEKNRNLWTVYEFISKADTREIFLAKDQYSFETEDAAELFVDTMTMDGSPVAGKASQWEVSDVRPHLNVFNEMISSLESDLNSDLSKVEQKEINLSDQFLAFKQDHYKVTINTAIRDAWMNDANVIRFPTAMTISFIEGYVDVDDSEGGRYREGAVEVGERLTDHEGRDGIIVDVDEYGYEIIVAEDGGGVREFYLDDFIAEGVERYVSEFADMEAHRETEFIDEIIHVIGLITKKGVNDDEMEAMVELDIQELLDHEKYGEYAEKVKEVWVDRYERDYEHDDELDTYYDNGWETYEHGGTTYVVVAKEYESLLDRHSESFVTGADKDNFSLADVPNGQGYRDIAAKYGYDDTTDKDGIFLQYLKKTRKDLREVEDDNGFTWYESNITKQDGDAVVLFQTEDKVKKSDKDSEKYIDDVAAQKALDSIGEDSDDELSRTGDINKRTSQSSRKKTSLPTTQTSRRQPAKRILPAERGKKEVKVTPFGNVIEDIQNINHYLKHYERSLTGKNTLYEKMQTQNTGIKEMTEMLLESFEEQYKANLKSNSLTMKDFDSYMKARAIGDRLEMMRKRRQDPSIREYAGWSEAKATRFLEGLSKEKLKGLQNVEVWYRNVIKQNQKLKVQYGIDSQRNIDMYNKREPNYVSWKEFGHVEDRGLYYNPYTDSASGLGRGQRKQQQALGRKSKSGDVTTNLLRETGELLKSVGQLNIERGLLNMLTSHAESSRDFEINPVKYKEKLNPETGLVEVVYDRVIDKDDFIVYDDTNRDEKGKAKRILVKGKSEVGQRIIQQLRNERTRSLEGTWLEWVAQYMRFIASMITMYSPEFALFTNPVRDFGTVMFQMEKYQEFRNMKNAKSKVIKNLPRAWKDIGKYQWGKDKSGDFALLREFGGKTGWTVVSTDYQKTNKHILARLKNISRKNYNPMKGVRIAMEQVRKVNEVMENGIRLAVFRTLLDDHFPKGHHIHPKNLTKEERQVIDRAAFISKNVSLDFNMKGNQTGWMKATWLFINPAIQGAERTIETFKQKKTRHLLYLAFGAWTMNAMMQMIMMGDDDDDGQNDYENLPNYQKNTGLNFLVAEDKVVHIPLPLNLAMVNTMANMVAKYTLMSLDTEDEFKLNNKSVYDDMIEMLASVMYSLAPVDIISSENPLEELLPEILQLPLVDIPNNENFFGSPIYKDDSAYDKHPAPAPYNYKDGTNQWAVELSQLLHHLSGGDETDLGRGKLANIHPESLEYTFDYLLGGFGSFIRRAVHLPAKLQDDSVRLSDIPFVRRALKDRTDYSLTDRYREAIDEAIRGKSDNRDLWLKATLSEKIVKKYWQSYSGFKEAGKDAQAKTWLEKINEKQRNFLKFYMDN